MASSRTSGTRSTSASPSNANTSCTFSCDTAYSASPTALRASSRSRKMRMWLILPSIRSYTLVLGHAMRKPLARPVELLRSNASTRLPSTSSTPSSSIRQSDAASSMSVRKRLMLIADRFGVQKVDVEVGGGILDIDQPLSDALTTLVDTDEGLQRRMKLDVLGAAREIALEVACVECGDKASHDLHVLLRHRL